MTDKPPRGRVLTPREIANRRRDLDKRLPPEKRKPPSAGNAMTEPQPTPKPLAPAGAEAAWPTAEDWWP
jgi:hypothetical protein